jgi:ABC-2 type transport system permease protein
MNLDRLTAIVRKDLLELRRSPGVLVPVIIMMVVTIAIPFLIAIAIPRLTGESLAEDSDFRRAVGAAAERLPELADLEGEAAVQAFLFQQFLLFLVLVPVTATMTVASHGVIGEKQNRSLEPLLATPLTTAELLLAKVVAAFLPALVLEGLAVAIYLGGILRLSSPGVADVLLSPRTGLIVGLVGPLAALVALQLSVITSSRVNDARSAQQIGVLVILPIIGSLVAQFAGVFWLTSTVLLVIAGGLMVVWLLLVGIGIRLFERETILTRWT